MKNPYKPSILGNPFQDTAVFLAFVEPKIHHPPIQWPGLGDLDPRHRLPGAALDQEAAQRGLPPTAAGVPTGGRMGCGDLQKWRGKG